MDTAHQGNRQPPVDGSAAEMAIATSAGHAAVSALETAVSGWLAFAAVDAMLASLRSVFLNSFVKVSYTNISL